MALTIFKYILDKIELKIFFLPSEIISLNHKDILYIVLIILINTKYSYKWKPCINRTAEVVRINNETLVYKGQGEGDTKWNGWFWKFAFVLYIIYYKE